MTFKYLNKIIFNKNTKIKDILKGFNKTAIHTEKSGFAIIVDDKGKCVGVVTDGDIRNKLLKKISIDDLVFKAMNKKFSFVKKGDSSHIILRQFDKRVSNLPVLDIKGIPVDLYQYSKFMASHRGNEHIIRARVPLRVSYSGGGTDMSSYIDKSSAAVLSSTINKYCTCSIITRDDKEIHINSKDLGLKYSVKNIDNIEYGDDLDLIKAAIKIMEPNFGFDIETFAEFNPGTGLGGSSAVVASVLGALNYFRNEKQLDLYELADLAYQVERIEMKIKGGWQDQYATIFGGINWIEFNKNEILVNPLRINKNTLLELEYNLMLFKLGGSRSSSKIQERHISHISKNNKRTDLSKMLLITNKMKEALLKGQVKYFADLLHEAWVVKRKINKEVSNQYIEDCYDIARNMGALGGKLLGAGGSGYLLIYSSPIHQKKIKSLLEKKGALQEPFKFCSTGLEVWATKR